MCSLAAALAEQGLELVYADQALLLINKPSGLLSVPGRDIRRRDSIAQRAAAVVPEALIVHRLDMETSGLMVLARGKTVHRTLSMAFQNRAVNKRYIALVEGKPSAPCGEINLPLMTDWPNRPRQIVEPEHGKPSLTRYRILAGQDDISRLELIPLTGRSHQLRVHLQAIGHPILGDTLYAPENVQKKAPRLLLHAESLAFLHPINGRALLFSSPPPF